MTHHPMLVASLAQGVERVVEFLKGSWQTLMTDLNLFTRQYTSVAVCNLCRTWPLEIGWLLPPRQGLNAYPLGVCRMHAKQAPETGLPKWLPVVAVEVVAG